MVQLIDRIARLERIGLSAKERESIGKYCNRVQKSWAAVVLESYRDGRLDRLAADPNLPVSLLLEILRQAGHVVLIGSHWHPLFQGDDEDTNEKVRAVFNANWRPHWDTEIRAIQRATTRKDEAPMGPKW